MTEKDEETTVPEPTEQGPPEYPEPIILPVYHEYLSAECGELALALSKAQSAVANAEKSKEAYNYSYAPLDNITDIIRPVLEKYELAVIQSHEFLDKGEENLPSVITHTRLIHSSGQSFRNSLELPIKEMANLTPAQMIGVCCTYGRRYALQSLFMIAGETDTDGA